MNDYLNIVRSLPLPTLAQTERFARYVSGAHSWYKHLPLYPKVPFIFYLDPGAGMNRIHTQSGEMGLHEVTDESTRFHYTWQTTADYRRRFGHWNYFGAHGSAFMYSDRGGVVDTAGSGPKVFREGDGWIPIPPDLVNCGIARLNAMIHPSPNFMIWMNSPERFGLSAFINPARPAEMEPIRTLLDEYSRTGANFSEVERTIPPDLIEHMRPAIEDRDPLLDFGYSEREWDWPDAQWLQPLEHLGLPRDRISLFVKVFDNRRRLSRSRTDRLGINDLLVEERGRQLAAMTDAMYRVLDAITVP